LAIEIIDSTQCGGQRRSQRAPDTQTPHGEHVVEPFAP
jgi:hypothetical protein